MSMSSICSIAIDPAIKLSPSMIRRLSSRFTVYQGWPEKMPVKGLLVHSKLSESFLKTIEGLEWIAVRAKNTDYVPSLPGIRKFGIPSLGAIPVAEHTFALILGLYKHLAESNLNIKQGRWQEGLGLNRELYGKTLGIIGYGSIGQRVGQIAAAFGLNILIAQSTADSRSGQVSLEELMAKSDIVTIHITPKTTEPLINKSNLCFMKKEAILINTSRGCVLDEGDVKDALDACMIAGVALDVFKDEPPSNFSLAYHKKVLATPHRGYQTEESLDRMNEALVEAVLKEVREI